MENTNIARAKKISVFVFDVDGTLTDGKIYISAQGETQKAFCVKDGLGISAASELGYKFILLTGRESELLKVRAQELKITLLYQGVKNKLDFLHQLCSQNNFVLEQIAYLGDDLNDLAVLSKVGLACAPQNAVQDVKETVHIVTQNAGGQGAAREVIEFVVKAQGKWEEVLKRFV